MSDDRAVYRKALVGVIVVAAVIVVVGAIVAWRVQGASAAGAAALGGGLSGLAAAVTPLSMLLGRDRPPHVLAAVVSGLWLAKMVVLVVVVVLLSRIEDFPRAAFGYTLLAGIIASLAVDLWAVRSTRVPYVDSDS